MNFRKITSVMVAAALVLSVTAGTTDAARGGAKLGGAPKISTPAPKATTPSTSQKKTGPNNKEYAPSKNANEYNKTAPQSGTGQAATAPNTGTRWGNVMRGIGFFAGGMLLGHLLSNMLGMGGGFLADVFGLLFNIILVYAVFKLILYVIRRFRNRGKGTGYSSPYTDYNTIDNDYKASHNSRGFKIQDIGQPSNNGADYDAKTTANKYRNM